MKKLKTKREFGVNDLAHFKKSMMVRGIINCDCKNESYFDFELNRERELKVVGYERVNDEFGGFLYKCQIEIKNTLYIIECINQIDLVSTGLFEAKGLHVDGEFELESECKSINFKNKENTKSITVNNKPKGKVIHLNTYKKFKDSKYFNIII